VAQPFLQTEYGGFDTRFLGVTLRFHSSAPGELARFLALAFEPASRVRHRFDAESLQDLAMVSVLEHETRHLHDYVLSPHGNAIFRRRVAAMLYGMRAFGVLRNCSVAVPLVQWRRMSGEQRRTQQEIWDEPVVGMDGMDEDELRRAAQCYETIRNDLVAPGEFQPVDLYEASAVLAQTVAIESMLGQAGAARFLGAVLRGELPVRYVRVIRTIVSLWERKGGRPPDLRELSAVTSWALLGASHLKDEDDPPTRRLLRLLEHFIRNGLPDLDRELRDAFAAWDTALGYRSVRDVLADNALANRNLAAQLASAETNGSDGLATTVVETCRRGIDCLIGANETMARLYTDDPDEYVDPDRYFTSRRKLDGPVRLDFVGGVVRQETLPTGFEIYSALGDPATGRSGVRTALLCLRTPGAIDGQVAITVASHLMLFDYILSDLNRQDPDFDLARQQLQAAGIRTLELLPF
jgi:hypothetical protein